MFACTAPLRNALATEIDAGARQRYATAPRRYWHTVLDRALGTDFTGLPSDGVVMP